MQHTETISNLETWLAQQSHHIQKAHRILSELHVLTNVEIETMDTHKLETLIQEITHNIECIAQYETPIDETIRKVFQDVSQEHKDQYLQNIESIEDFILQYNNFIQDMEEKRAILQSRMAYAESFIAQL